MATFQLFSIDANNQQKRSGRFGNFVLVARISTLAPAALVIGAGALRVEGSIKRILYMCV